MKLERPLEWIEVLRSKDLAGNVALNDNCNYQMLFITSVLFSGRSFTGCRASGAVEKPDDIHQLLVDSGAVRIRDHKKFTKAAHLVNEGGFTFQVEEDDTMTVYSADWGLMTFQQQAFGALYDLQIFDATEERVWVNLFREKLLKMFSNPKEDKGAVFALLVSEGSLELCPIGKMDDDLVRENYSEQVLTDFDHFCGCLRSNEPCGRIVLLNGPPGTGKSYMIRSIIHEIPGVHIIIPGSVVDRLSSPEFLSILHGAHQGGKPIILHIEDADAAVRDRKAGNFRILTDILNLGDGLLGQMLDIRIIASTNAKKIELDDAVTRPGRMCRHSTLNDLPHEHAKAVLTRLTDGKTTELKKGSHSLAELYRIARADGWQKEEDTPKYEGGNYA